MPHLKQSLLFMFLSLASACTAAVAADAPPESYKIEYDIQPLKGKLDKIPMFNSNSPEIVPDSGILLSTLDPKKKKHPEAHLKYAVKGQFTVFFHHINKQEEKSNRKLLTVSLLVYNPSSSKATLTYDSLASYVSQPDAPVYVIPPLVADDEGKTYAGQGDRVASDYVRGEAELKEPFTINVSPRSYALVTELPIKVYGGVSTLNGRSYFAECEASKPLQLALVASFSEPPHSGAEAEAYEAWRPQGAREAMEELVEQGQANYAKTKKDRGKKDLNALVKILEEDNLSAPREGDKRAPTPPGDKAAIVYGRVSGVQMGSTLTAERTLTLQTQTPLAVAYPISSVEQGTMGTDEVQAAPLIKRYENSAYASHGNYCVHYQVDLKLANHAKEARKVFIGLSTPLKTDKLETTLTYYKEQAKQVFFRGVIKVSESDPQGKFADNATAHYYHLVEHRGERVAPFSRVDLAGGENRTVRVELYYTPDATPPQMLTIDSAVEVAPVVEVKSSTETKSSTEAKSSTESKSNTEVKPSPEAKPSETK